MTYRQKADKSRNDRPALTKEEAIGRLALEIQFKTEHLDSGEGDWANLDERSRSFYRQCVKWLLAHPEIVRVALGR